MSRNTKKITVNDKEIVINELTVRQCRSLLDDIVPSSAEDILSNDDFLKKHWANCITGLTVGESEDLTPSELKEIYATFEEVNAVFFDVALRVVGENPFLVKLRAEIMNDLISRFAALSKKDIPEPGTTDIVSSSAP